MKKVFLGGTCNESTWRNDLIPLLEIDYFNPVVDDWTEDCKEKELQERETCDVCLYAITPKMSGVYSIAEVVDESNKRPTKTVLILLKKDERIFKNSQWESLKTVAKMVEKNGGKVFYSLALAAEYLNKF